MDEGGPTAHRGISLLPATPASDILAGWWVGATSHSPGMPPYCLYWSHPLCSQCALLVDRQPWPLLPAPGALQWVAMEDPASCWAFPTVEHPQDIPYYSWDFTVCKLVLISLKMSTPNIVGPYLHIHVTWMVWLNTQAWCFPCVSGYHFIMLSEESNFHYLSQLLELHFSRALSFHIFCKTRPRTWRLCNRWLNFYSDPGSLLNAIDIHVGKTSIKVLWRQHSEKA